MSRPKAVYQIGVCPDCGREEVEINSIHNICRTCLTRKRNSINRRKEYIPYVNLSMGEKRRVDAHVVNKSCVMTHDKNNEIIIAKDVDNNTDNFNTDQFIKILQDCGSEMSVEKLKALLEVLFSIDKLKCIVSIITESDQQQNMLDLEQMLNVAENKLQHDWEYNNFNNEYDALFKNFLLMRRQLKQCIFFWKKIYQTGVLIELKTRLDSYNSDPSDKTLVNSRRTTSVLKRYKITTNSISTILNTRKPFTRIFYATDEADARNQLTTWLKDRQLHEDKSATVVTLLT